MENNEKPEQALVPAVPKSLVAEASSAHSRINVPLNITVWKDLPEEYQQELVWWHQHLLDGDLGWEDAEEALDYDHTTIFKVLRGTYDGSWPSVIKAIRSYRKLATQRASVQMVHFQENPISKSISWALDYIMARGSCGLIMAEAGMGKTVGTKHWQSENNHGRSVLVECLPIGGAKGLLRQISAKVGVNRNLSITQGFESVLRAFNRNRILILDEVHQLLPSDARSRPTSLEMVRRIHDLTGCALAMVSTVRFEQDLKAQRYMFEQILGRTGKPFVLPNEFTWEDISGIVTQFVKRPSRRFVEDMVAMSNNRELGRLRYVVECLSFASKMAHDTGRMITEDLVRSSHRERMHCGQTSKEAA